MLFFAMDLLDAAELDDTDTVLPSDISDFDDDQETPDYVQELDRHAAVQFPDLPLHNMVGDKDDADDVQNGWSGIYPEENDADLERPNDIGNELCSGDTHLAFGTLKGNQVGDLSVMALFELFFPNSMWMSLCENTNKYANAIMSRLGEDAFERSQHAEYRRHARINKWKDIDVGEMKLFFAHLILMGLTRKPEIELYWATDSFTNMPFFGRFMSRDRFTSILSNLHVADDTDNPKYGEEGHDPLAKLRPFITLLNEKFVDVYESEQELSLDEGCCPFKGRLRFKCYNPNKPHKFHIKLFCICEASSGYTVGFKVYAGAGTCHRDDPDLYCSPDCGITTKTVITLADDCKVLDKGRVMYFDNYYSSPELFYELLYRETQACGTVRSNRKGLPMAVVNAKFTKGGEVIWRRQKDESLDGGGLLALKWLEKKKVSWLYPLYIVPHGVGQEKESETQSARQCTNLRQL